MGDRELKDLRQQVRQTRRFLEANERRRALLQRPERPHRVRAGVAALGSGAMWLREHPVRLATVAALAFLGTAGVTVPSSVTDDEPKRPPIAALPEADYNSPAATITLSSVNRDTAEEPDEEPAGDWGAGSGGGQDSDPHASAASPSRNQVQQSTADTSSEPAPSAETDLVPSGPAPEPELSGTGESYESLDGAPEPADPPAQETSDDGADDGEASVGTCLGVNALGLTVDLCLPSLLGG